MKLSVIVPVYNMTGGNKLNWCLDSLLGQTIRERGMEYEILAVDDASTDDSLALLREYERKYPEMIRVISCKENHRQGGAKNRGLKEAKGEWIGFVDADDYVAPQMYEKLILRGEESGADVVGCDYTIVPGHQWEPGQNVANNTTDQVGDMDHDRHASMILRHGSMVVKIYRQAMIRENHLDFPEGIFYEDNCAGALWSMYYKHFEYIPEAMYYYLTLPGSTTHHVSWDKCRDRMTSGRIFLQECEKRGLMEEYKEEILFHFFEIAYKTTLFSYMYSGKKRKMRHTAELRDMAEKFIPDIGSSGYYDKMVPEEEKRLLALHRKSNSAFFVYYVALFGYRNLRKKLGGGK